MHRSFAQNIRPFALVPLGCIIYIPCLIVLGLVWNITAAAYALLLCVYGTVLVLRFFEWKRSYERRKKLNTLTVSEECLYIKFRENAIAAKITLAGSPDVHATYAFLIDDNGNLTDFPNYLTALFFEILPIPTLWLLLIFCDFIYYPHSFVWKYYNCVIVGFASSICLVCCLWLRDYQNEHQCRKKFAELLVQATHGGESDKQRIDRLFQAIEQHLSKETMQLIRKRCEPFAQKLQSVTT